MQFRKSQLTFTTFQLTLTMSRSISEDSCPKIYCHKRSYISQGCLRFPLKLCYLYTITILIYSSKGGIGYYNDCPHTYNTIALIVATNRSILALTCWGVMVRMKPEMMKSI